MQVNVKQHSKFPEIYLVNMGNGVEKLATKNLTPRRNVYGEKLVRHEGVEYRICDVFRSKLFAAIVKNIKNVPIKPDNSVLYLGAASGTTSSHVSDIVGEKGSVYCVEFSSRTIRELIDNVCLYRSNMFPILEDARFPENYIEQIIEKVDNIYCDIAQQQQAKILADNADLFLKDSGRVMFAVKAQSIDVTKDPAEVYKGEIEVLEKRGFKIEECVQLDPLEKAHAMIVAQLH